MKKEVGYVISIIGLVVMSLGFGVFKIEHELISKIGGSTITLVGAGLVGGGVIISLMDKKGRRNKADKEVPIYEGKGKNRKIVGYQRD